MTETKNAVSDGKSDEDPLYSLSAMAKNVKELDRKGKEYVKRIPDI